MSEIHWEDPPADARGGKKKFTGFFNELKKHPGKWAIFPGSRSTARNHSKKVPELEVREVRQGQPDGQIYIRWNGES